MKNDRQLVEERVYAFIEDYYDWARDCRYGSDATSFPSPCGLDVDGLQAMAEDLQHEFENGGRSRQKAALAEIARQHCVTPGLLTDSGWHISWPPDHDPEVESINHLSIQDDRAEVTTSCEPGSGMAAGFEYILALTRQGWRIERIRQFHSREDDGPPEESNPDLLKQETTDELSTLDDCGFDFSPAFTAGTPVTVMDRPAKITVEKAGRLAVPSGRLLVWDSGFLTGDARPLSLKIPPGNHEILLSQAGNHNGCAMLAWGRRDRVTAYVPVQLVGRTEDYHVSVDTGTACIADAKAVLSLNDREREKLHHRIVEATFANDQSRDHVLIGVREKGAPELVNIHAGMGDGGYACYAGIDDEGAPQCLVIDFSIYGKNVEHERIIPWRDKGREIEINDPILIEHGFSISIRPDLDKWEVVEATGQQLDAQLLGPKHEVLSDTGLLGSDQVGRESIHYLKRPDAFIDGYLRFFWTTWASDLEKDWSF